MTTTTTTTTDFRQSIDNRFWQFRNKERQQRHQRVRQMHLKIHLYNNNNNNNSSSISNETTTTTTTTQQHNQRNNNNNNRCLPERPNRVQSADYRPALCRHRPITTHLHCDMHCNTHNG
jgi:hypothetical protein